MATILSLEKKLFEKKLKEDPPVQGNPTHLNSRGNLTDDCGREVFTLSMYEEELKALHDLLELVKTTRYFEEDFIGWNDEVWAAKNSLLTPAFIQKIHNEGYDVFGAKDLLARITKPAPNIVRI